MLLHQLPTHLLLHSTRPALSHVYALQMMIVIDHTPFTFVGMILCTY